MNPNEPIILTGEAARRFTEYQNTKATPEEIAYFKKCEKIYLKHCKPKQASKHK